MAMITQREKKTHIRPTLDRGVGKKRVGGELRHLIGLDMSISHKSIFVGESAIKEVKCVVRKKT